MEKEYRAWNKKQDRMLEVDSICYSLDTVMCKYPEYDTYVWETMNNFILMKSPGLRDKKGRRIYEKDILKVYSLKYIVFYDEETATWCCRSLDNGKEHFLFQFVMNEVEVIGDELSNPDLLTA